MLRLCLMTILGIAICCRAMADEPEGFPAPRTFTFQTNGAPLGKILDELAKQTGVTVDRSRLEEDRTLRLNSDKLTFWDAFEKIARESDHRISVAEDGKRLQLLGGGDITYKEIPTSVDRVFRVAVRRVQSTIDLDEDRAYTEVTLNLLWESGINVFLVGSPGRSVVAKDNNEQDLTAAEEDMGRVPVAGNGVDITIRLTGVNRAAKTIRLLNGKLSVIGAAKMVELSFPKPIAAKENRESREGDVTVRLRTDFKEKSDLWVARVEIEYPPGGPQFESFESSAWLADNMAWLASPDGKKKLECNGGYQVLSQTERKATVLYHFTDDPEMKLGKPEDWVFHIKTPAKLISTEVKFRLENIPLP